MVAEDDVPRWFQIFLGRIEIWALLDKLCAGATLHGKQRGTAGQCGEVELTKPWALLPR